MLSNVASSVGLGCNRLSLICPSTLPSRVGCAPVAKRSSRRRADSTANHAKYANKKFLSRSWCISRLTQLTPSALTRFLDSSSASPTRNTAPVKSTTRKVASVRQFILRRPVAFASRAGNSAGCPESLRPRLRTGKSSPFPPAWNGCQWCCAGNNDSRR